MITKRRSFTKKNTERQKKKRRSTKKISNKLSNNFGKHVNTDPISESINMLPFSKTNIKFIKKISESFSKSIVNTTSLPSLKQKIIFWVLNSKLGKHLITNPNWLKYFISWM